MDMPEKGIFYAMLKGEWDVRYSWVYWHKEGISDFVERLKEFGIQGLRFGGNGGFVQGIEMQERSR